MTNFSFLHSEKDFETFSALAIVAEQILYIDLAACVLNCRWVMEVAAKWVHLVDKQLVTPYDDRLDSQIERC